MRRMFLTVGIVLVAPAIAGRMFAVFLDSMSGPPPLAAWVGIALLLVAGWWPKQKERA